LFAALLIDLGRVKPELVEQRAGGPHLVDERVRLADLRSESREERLLQREHEGGRLRRAEAHLGPPARDLVQHLANRLPLRAREVRKSMKSRQTVSQSASASTPHLSTLWCRRRQAIVGREREDET